MAPLCSCLLLLACQLLHLSVWDGGGREGEGKGCGVVWCGVCVGEGGEGGGGGGGRGEGRGGVVGWWVVVVQTLWVDEMCPSISHAHAMNCAATRKLTTASTHK